MGHDCNHAFNALLRSNGIMELDYWCQNEGMSQLFTAQLDQWYHLALSWDGSNNRAHVDGQLVRQAVGDSFPDTIVDNT